VSVGFRLAFVGRRAGPDQRALESFKRCFTDNEDTSDDSFEAKYQRQLAGQDEAVVKLAAELVLISCFLRPCPELANATIQKVVSWKQLEIPPAGIAAMQCLDDGIGGPGLAYNTHRPFEIGFLAESARRLVSMPVEERRAVSQVRNVPVR
jgi:5-methylcytosine-specific restriction enzyme B